MSKIWKSYELGKISTIYNGNTPSTKNIEFWDGNIIWITPKDLSDQNKKYISRGERTITKKALSKTKLLPKGTILLSSRAPIGLVSISNTELVTNQGFKNIVVNQSILSNEFLYYHLKLRKLDLYRLGSGTTFKELSKSSLESIIIRFPDLPTQKSIAKILSDIDAKIELNNRINAQLEAMAKLIYDYWFVQFNFPYKKAGTEALEGPYKSSGGKMVWNKELKREIPEGWEVQKMSEWIEIDKSGDWGKDEAIDNFTKKVICFRGADINGLNGLDELKPPVRYILEKNSFKILKSHDLIIEISGGSPTQSTGRLAFITDATIKRFEHPLICSNFCKPVSIKNKKLLYNFAYYWKSLYENNVFFAYEGKTSGIKNLLFDSFISSYYTVVPDEKIVEQFYVLMENIQEKKQTALAENQHLTSLRDWLLPMLMNGQVNVHENIQASPAMAADEAGRYRVAKNDTNLKSN